MARFVVMPLPTIAASSSSRYERAYGFVAIEIDVDAAVAREQLTEALMVILRLVGALLGAELAFDGDVEACGWVEDQDV